MNLLRFTKKNKKDNKQTLEILTVMNYSIYLTSITFYQWH